MRWRSVGKECVSAQLREGWLEVTPSASSGFLHPSPHNQGYYHRSPCAYALDLMKIENLADEFSSESHTIHAFSNLAHSQTFHRRLFIALFSFSCLLTAACVQD